MKHIPFTYLIGWSKHNIWYYGVRYAKNCSPNDLWTKYFTSSKRVWRCRTKLGEPDVIEIRKTFLQPKDALIWEQKVIDRMKLTTNPNWLNMSRSSNKVSQPMYGHRNGFYGCKHSEESINKMRGPRPHVIPWNKGISFNSGSSNYFYGKTHSEEKKREWSKVRRGRIWVNNGIKETLIDPDSIIEANWQMGRLSAKRNPE